MPHRDNEFIYAAAGNVGYEQSQAQLKEANHWRQIASREETVTSERY